MVRELARAALLALDEYVCARNLAGPDPYDALSGALRGRISHSLMRQAAVQVVKRSPINLRRAFGIRPLRMSKTLGLIAESLAVMPDLPNARSRQLRLLDELVVRRGAGGWGYEFDVQTRWGYYAEGTPNIIVTAFALEALRHSDAHLEAVREPVLEWLERDMLHRGFIRYVPSSDVLVHNANMLGARALARVAPGHPALAGAVDQTVSRQCRDGTWPYGEAPHLQWVDGFHTAYILLALQELVGSHPDAEAALRRGTDTYAERFFARDGRPYYYLDRPGPVDVHNVATALHALAALASRSSKAALLQSRVLHHLLTLQRQDGSFRVAASAPAFMRWNQAHAHRALAQVGAAA